jgi:TPR repeat protein
MELKTPKRILRLATPTISKVCRVSSSFSLSLLSPAVSLFNNNTKKAAKQGVLDSMVNVGLALANGHGVEANVPEAFKWWKKASNRGSPVATGNVGRCYEVGLGNDINLDKAMEFYKKGVLLEDGGSMYHLSNMYFKGKQLQWINLWINPQKINKIIK